MKNSLVVSLSAAVLGLGLAAATPASAAETAPAPRVDLQQAYPGENYTQYRRYRGRSYVGRRNFNRPYRYGYGRPYYRDGRGGAAAAGVIGGLAAGALLGGAIAAQGAPAVAVDQNYLAYCSQKYRSFDPESGTYLGYDGERHACQYP